MPESSHGVRRRKPAGLGDCSSPKTERVEKSALSHNVIDWKQSTQPAQNFSLRISRNSGVFCLSWRSTSVLMYLYRARNHLILISLLHSHRHRSPTVFTRKMDTPTVKLSLDLLCTEVLLRSRCTTPTRSSVTPWSTLPRDIPSVKRKTVS
jgi:hypothetical protein